MANSIISLSFLLSLFSFCFAACGQPPAKYVLPVRENHAEIGIERLIDAGHKRVKLILQRLEQAPGSAFIALPIQTGYVVTLVIGEMPQQVSLVVDSGSSMVWWQCDCFNECFESHIPRYDSSSASFKEIYCDDVDCQFSENSFIFCAKDPYRSRNEFLTCNYNIKYADGDRSIGTVAREFMQFKDYRGDSKKIIFGCGEVQRGMYFSPNSSGVLGLSNNPYSLVRQLNSTNFSICLPTRGFGNASTLVFNDLWPLPSVYTVTTTMYNPQLPINEGLYYVWIKEIRVGDYEVEVPQSVWGFDRGGQGSVVDIGTPITYLPYEAYIKLRDLFRTQMRESAKDSNRLTRLTEIYMGFETCYRIPPDLKLNLLNRIPIIYITFNDGAQYMAFVPDQVMIEVSNNIVCLAFWPSPSADGNFTLLGSNLFQRVRIYFSMPSGNRHGQISFKSEDCS